jgi:hypothetical protein
MIMVDLILMSLYNLSYVLAFLATISQLIIVRYIGTYVPQTQSYAYLFYDPNNIIRWSQPTVMNTIQPTIIALERESFYR